MFNRIKLQWQLLIVFLPLSILPLLIITVFTIYRIFGHLENQTGIFYQDILTQVSETIDFVYDLYGMAFAEITLDDDFTRIIDAPRYKTAIEEEQFEHELYETFTTPIGSSMRRSILAKFSGTFTIIEYDKPSIVNGTDYKVHYFVRHILDVDADRLRQTPLFKELDNYFDTRLVLGRLDRNVLKTADAARRPVFLYPIYRDGMKSFTKMLMVVMEKDFLSTFYRDAGSLENGTLLILDRMGNIMSTMQSEAYPVPDPGALVRENSGIRDIINGPASGPARDHDRSRIIINNGISYLALARYAQSSHVTLLYLHPVPMIRKPVYRIIAVILIMLVMLIVLVLFSSFRVSRFITDPVKKLSFASQKIASGDYHVSFIKTQLDNEIGTLTDAFNTMASEVRRHTSNLEELVFERTSELKKAEEQKTLFFINLAHETKTPLTLIKNYLDSYIKKRGMDEDLGVVKYYIDKMTRDIVNFMDHEKLERGQVYYNHDQVTSLSELILMKVRLFNETARRKNVTIDQSVESGLIIKADPLALDRVINNLLDNAVKYNMEGGRLSINCDSTDGGIVITVCNDGEVIKQENMATVFEPYHQLSYEKRSVQGIGMGLSIVKKIVNSLGGEISVSSEPGAGTCFTVRFDAALKVTGEDTAPDSTADLSGFVSGQGGVLSIDTTPFVEGRAHLLLVEDNMDMCSFLQEGLGVHYNLEIVHDGRDAISFLKEHGPVDLIISDIMMDGIDGYGLMGFLSKSDDLNDMPLIFLTARATLDEKVKGLNAGAIDYIYKPFALEELVSRVNAVIRARMLQKEQQKQQIQKRISKVLDTLDGEEDELVSRENFFKKQCDAFSISSRESEVIECLLTGKMNKEISDVLGISIKTVENHIRKIFEKTGVANRVELVNLFRQ
jgi:signal transduction histidine kinase/DNA-binding NarL/FixJ family response regulator